MLTVGIVTISYNQARFLPETINSVQLKDRNRLKYVIVDPGSTDGSREVIQQHRHLFEVVILEPDEGPADGLNKGFQRCPADILGYLNSDDRLSPGALEFVLDFFESHPGVDVLLGGIRMIDASGKPQRRRRIPWRFSAQDFLDGTCVVLQQGCFFRRSAFERTSGFNRENFTCWDTELMIDMALRGARFQRVFKVLGEFRLYPESICGSQLLGGSQRMIWNRLTDHERIGAKIKAAGISAASGLALRSKQIAFKFSPARRLREWTVR